MSAVNRKKRVCAGAGPRTVAAEAERSERYGTEFEGLSFDYVEPHTFTDQPEGLLALAVLLGRAQRRAARIRERAPRDPSPGILVPGLG